MTRASAAVVRLGVVLCLLLAALLLGVDSREYPGDSAPGLKALARGPLLLLVVGCVNLVALEVRRATMRWRAAAVAANVLMLVRIAELIDHGAAPGFWMLAAIAALLVLASAAELRHERLHR